MRIDAHIHLWQRSQYQAVYESYDRPPELQPLLRDFSVQELQANLTEAGIDRAVLIQLAQTDAHNDELLAIAAREECIGAVVGWVDLASAALSHRLQQLSHHPLMRGIRDPLEGKDADWLHSPGIRSGLRALAECGWLFELLVSQEHWALVVSLAKDIPDLPLVINHFGKPTETTLEEWDRRLLSEIAAMPQVHVKLSGIMALFPDDRWSQWSVAELQPFVDRLLERLGPRRLLVGTDWPVATLAGSYTRHVTALETTLASLSDAEQGLILGENARRLYRMD
ncbi:MAG: amidohydrolase family protein [Chloroflexi bacterium]|nr:amidohydrolase family protein [Chloroflexota bacterium]